nr:hypothetical protein [Sphingomonas sp. CDS-1]
MSYLIYRDNLPLSDGSGQFAIMGNGCPLMLISSVGSWDMQSHIALVLVATTASDTRSKFGKGIAKGVEGGIRLPAANPIPR